MLVFRISRLYTQALQSNNFFFESCQKCQNSVHTFPQDFSFFSSLLKLVELWLKKKGENNWTSQRLGYQNARKIMGSLNIGLFFLIGGWKIACIKENCPKRLFLTFFTTKTYLLLYRASWKLTYTCIGIPSACACKIMEIDKFMGTQKWRPARDPVLPKLKKG